MTKTAAGKYSTDTETFNCVIHYDDKNADELTFQISKLLMGKVINRFSGGPVSTSEMERLVHVLISTVGRGLLTAYQRVSAAML